MLKEKEEVEIEETQEEVVDVTEEQVDVYANVAEVMDATGVTAKKACEMLNVDYKEYRNRNKLNKVTGPTLLNVNYEQATSQNKVIIMIGDANEIRSLLTAARGEHSL